MVVAGVGATVGEGGREGRKGSVGSGSSGEGDVLVGGTRGVRGASGDEEVMRPWRISQDGVRSLVDVAVAGVGYLL